MPTAFVSGAASGIGRAIAIRLAQDGFDIAINDVPDKDLTDVISEVEAKGRKALAVPADVRSAKSVEEAVAKTVAELGSLDVMVANAGIWRPTPIETTTPEEWDSILQVNLYGVFNCLQSAAKQMIKQGHGGRLIAASSVAGRAGFSGSSAYSASKFAVRGIVQSLSLELATYGITANCYCPTFVDTPMVHSGLGARPGVLEHLAKGIPMGRIANVDDVANVASFLAGKESSFITGQSINICGGSRLD